MEPYQKMYRALTGSIARAIEILQEGQKKAEEIYMNAEQPSPNAPDCFDEQESCIEE